MNDLTFNSISLIPEVEQFSLRKLFEKYLEHFCSEPSTLRAKSGDFKELLLYLGRGNPERPTLRDFTKAHVDAFRDHRAEHGEAYSTINRRLATYKHFSRVLAERLPTYHDDIRHVQVFELAPVTSKALTDEERARIRACAAFGSSPFSRARNRLIIEMFIETGVRLDEVVSIDMRHFEWPWIKALKTKGRKIRNIYLASTLEEICAVYLAARLEEMLRRARGYLYLTDKEKSEFPFFVSFYGAHLEDPESFRMSAESVRYIVYRVGELAQVEHLHPHRFRHDRATTLRKDGCDLEVIRKALGHSTLNMTQKYFAATDKEVAEAIEKTKRKA